MRKRVLAALLSCIMVFSLLPMNVLAAGDNTSVVSIEPDTGKYDTYVYKDGSDTVYTQIVRADENGEATLSEPVMPTKEGFFFVGWKDAEGNAPDFSQPVAVTGGQTHTYFANWRAASGQFFVYFLAGKGSNEVVATNLVSNGKVGRLPDYRPASGMVNHWVIKDTSTTVTENTDVTEDIYLEPVINPGCWVSFDTDGGSAVDAKYVAAGSTLDLNTVSKPAKAGYDFAGWTVNGAAVTSVNPRESMTLKATWTARNDTKYMVVYWQENANDNGYSYCGSAAMQGTTGSLISGSGSKNYPGFEYHHADSNKVIAADGSTVINVYYNRLTYTLTFKVWENWDWKTERTFFNVKFGQDTTSLFNDAPSGYLWYTGKYSDTFYTAAPDMPNSDLTIYGKSSSDYTSTIYYYEKGTTKDIKSPLTVRKSGWSFTKEDYIGIPGFTYNSSSHKSWSNDYYIYYTRNNYTLTFNNYGSKTSQNNIPYEASLTGKGYKPAAPAGFDADDTFDGWFIVPPAEWTEDSKPFDFATATMPAGDLILFAHWSKAQVTLTVQDADGKQLKTGSYSKGTVIAGTDAFTSAKDKISDDILYWVDAESGARINENSALARSMTIKPVLAGTTFSVTYQNANGSASTAADNNDYWYGAFAKTQPGDGKLLYWQGSDGKTYYPGDAIEMHSDITLTAVLSSGSQQEPKKVGLTYHNNFGDTDVPSVVPKEYIVNSQIKVAEYTDLKDADGNFLPDRAGYTFTGWNTDANGNGQGFTAGATARIDNKGEGNHLYAQWTANTDTEYTVEFYYQNDDGSDYTKDTTKTEERYGTTDTLATVTDEDKEQTQNGKYVFDADNPNNNLSGNIAGNGSLVLKLYFKLNQAECIIHHYLLGTTVPVAEDEKSSVRIDQELKANPAESFIPGYEKAQFNSYKPDQSITVSTASKEITVYYTMPLVIKAGDAEKMYNGTPLTCSEFTVDGLVNGDTKSIVTLEMTDDSTITDAGTQANKIDSSSVKIIRPYYTFTCEDGKLEITQSNAEVTIKITGNNKTFTYDRTKKTVDGFTYTAEINGSPIDKTLFEVSTDKAYAEGTDAGTYKMGLTAGDFKVTSDNYFIGDNITVEIVEDGWLLINPVSDEVVITINGKIDEAIYDGTEKSAKGYTVDYDKLNPEDFKISYTGEATASGTDADTYYMGLTEKNFEVTSDNYSKVKVVVNDGRLTIGKRTVTLVSADLSKEYDGSPLKNGDTPLKTEKGWVEGEGATYIFTGSLTYPGTTENGNTFKVNYNEGTKADNYDVKSIFGDLKVTDRNTKYEINLTGRSAIYSYNGGEQSIDGFEALTFEIAGHTYTVTDVSHEAKGMLVSDRPYQGEITGQAVVLDENDTNVTEQFTVNITVGTLTITPAQLTITAGSDNKLYDSTALTCDKYDVNGLQGKDYIDSVSFVGSQTEPGSSRNVASNAVIKNAAGETVTSDYTITYEPGTLTVNTISKALKVEATDEEKMYDGEPLTGSYTYTEGVLLEGDELVIELEGSLTNAGECGNVIKSCKVMRGDVDVTKLYAGLTTKDGKLTITPREIKLSSGSKTWEYDGAEHRLPDVDVTGDGFAKGQDFAERIAIGAITNVGSVKNSIEYSFAEGTLPQNYSIQTEPGTLEVVKRGSVNEKNKVTITANDNRVYYDGREHGENGYTVTDNLLKEYGHALASVSIPFKAKDVGVYTGKLEPQNAVILDAQGNDVTENYLIEYNSGTLEIVKRHHPTTPSVTKPALNTDDHYAYVMGYPDGTVQPGGYITRAEASTIFFRLLTDETREQYWATTNAYSDVKGGDWYNNAISTLSNAGIVSGYPDGTFRPNAPITRAEMSKIIALFAKLDKTTDRFSDIAGHWAEAYIKLAAGNGWIEGYPDGSFRPNQSITRAETVTMINRVLERVPSDEDHLLSERVMLTFPDCKSGDWFYIAIQEATNSHTYERAATEKNGDEQWTALRANRDWTKFEQ